MKNLIVKNELLEERNFFEGLELEIQRSARNLIGGWSY